MGISEAFLTRRIDFNVEHVDRKESNRGWDLVINPGKPERRCLRRSYELSSFYHEIKKIFTLYPGRLKDLMTTKERAHQLKENITLIRSKLLKSGQLSPFMRVVVLVYNWVASIFGLREFTAKPYDLKPIENLIDFIAKIESDLASETDLDGAFRIARQNLGDCLKYCTNREGKLLATQVMEADLAWDGKDRAYRQGKKGFFEELKQKQPHELSDAERKLLFYCPLNFSGQKSTFEEILSEVEKPTNLFFTGSIEEIRSIRENGFYSIQASEDRDAPIGVTLLNKCLPALEGSETLTLQIKDEESIGQINFLNYTLLKKHFDVVVEAFAKTKLKTRAGYSQELVIANLSRLLMRSFLEARKFKAIFIGDELTILDPKSIEILED